MQVLPLPALRPFIKHYLFLESKEQRLKKLRFFSDGNTGLVFCFSDSLISGMQDNQQLHYLPASFLYGQISAFKDLYLTCEASLLIVVFQPDGIHRLLGIPAHTVSDAIIHTEDLFGQAGRILHEQLIDQTTIPNKLSLLNTFFSKLATSCRSAHPALIREALKFIIENNGTVMIRQLVNHTGYTERHLERTFHEHVGLSPKKFGNIVKLHRFLKILQANPQHDTITSLCYEAGYFDQSHLIREFRKYTGITPTDYLNHTNRLAINFMKFKY